MLYGGLSHNVKHLTSFNGQKATETSNLWCGIYEFGSLGYSINLNSGQGFIFRKTRYGPLDLQCRQGLSLSLVKVTIIEFSRGGRKVGSKFEL